jgi:hypothetical protein
MRSSVVALLIVLFSCSFPAVNSAPLRQGFDRSTVTAAQPNFDGPAELPRVYMKTALVDTPAQGKTWIAKESGNLQQTISNAACGDTIKLQAGTTFSGRFRLPYKRCDDSHWIIIRTSAPDSELTPENTRITPCYAGIASLPGRSAYKCLSAGNVLAKLVLTLPGDGPLVLDERANHYRLIGLEITRDVPGKSVHRLVYLEKDGTADHIIFDRIWLHGTAQDETSKGIQLGGSTYVGVVDSFFSDFHCVAITGACTDSQAIGGGNGQNPMGPYKIVNNFLEAAGEPIMFGGGPSTRTPADIEIRRNYISKPLIWKPDHEGFVGGTSGKPFIVKNLFELKNAQRVLFEGNVLENTWGGFSQTGFAVLLTPKNQSNQCPACRVTDITIRYSRISHVGSCFQIANALSAAGGASSGGERYSIHDVICDDVDRDKYKGFGNFAQISEDAPPLRDIRVNHVTAFVPNALFNVGTKDPEAHITNFVFTNNIVGAGPRQITPTGGHSNCALRPHPRTPASVLSNCFVGLEFSHNVIIGPDGWPEGNFNPKNASAVRFVNYNNGNGGDYHLRPDSPYKKGGTNQTDLGADVDAIEKATAGVR